MKTIWQKLIPELMSLRELDQIAILEKAKIGRYTLFETIVQVVWMLCVFFFSQEVIKNSLLENMIDLSLIVNLIVVLPLISVVFVLIYFRKMIRLIKVELNQYDKKSDIPS